jgi:mono/diheme cytochrome c family protein
VIAGACLQAGQAGHAMAPGGIAPRLPQTAASAAQSAAGQDRSFLDRYCVSCHNSRLKTAGLALDSLDVDRVGANPEVWEKVVDKLRTRSMPPADRPHPDSAAYDTFASRLETALERAAAARPNPGRTAIHRPNRAEYANAVRDLLALEVDARSLLPSEDAAFGFDNIADLLPVSTALLERYMSAAKTVSRLAIGDPSMRPVITTYDVSKRLKQVDRMSEELPFGSRGGIAVRHYFPLDGQYVMRFPLKKNDDNQIHALEERNEVEVRIDGALAARFTVGGRPEDQGRNPVADSASFVDPGLSITIPVKAGPRWVGVAFLKNTPAIEGTRPTREPYGFFKSGRDVPMGLGALEIGGPYNPTSGSEDTPSRRRVFVCRPLARADEGPCARKIFSTLARRAYRRPVSDDDLRVLLGFYSDERAAGGSFDSGVQNGLERLLVDPQFLFRIERDPPGLAPGTAYRLTDVDLASRLSFFLWSSIPDDQLLELAEQDRLHIPAVLEQQVRRMLADPRARTLVDNFAAQWLYLRNLRAVTPDFHFFPEFDEDLREAFHEETRLFLESQIREDHGLLDLLTANYTFINERLARHYGIRNVYGSHFRRVEYDHGERRGLLGQGSILTVTSYAHRTSPVLRGKWLLENVLGAPPPPPPPNIPALTENDEGKPPRTVRERLEFHRRNPACATCHARMDPLGFALENFDAVGRWRTTDVGTPIDASGTLPDGTRLEGVGDVVKMVLARPEQFTKTVTEKLLTYALGRGLEYYDQPTVRKIMHDAAPGDYRWSSIILGITASSPFQMRTVTDQESQQ